MLSSFSLEYLSYRFKIMDHLQVKSQYVETTLPGIITLSQAAVKFDVY